ncbi:MAG: D-alanyl-D-alanine carboxypeptidase/D-alanyl-D-alanine endopeptidase, partial [Paracoccaceae bacterium]
MLAGLGSGLGLAAATATPIWAGAPSRSLRPQARGQGVVLPPIPDSETLIAKARLGGQVSFAVAHSDDPMLLEQRGAGTGLPPASVAKALTAAYALFHLGPDYRFATQVIATGGVRNGAVLGDLILVGTGDPTLDTDKLFDLAARLKAAGITEVRGKFYVWGGGFRSTFSIDAGQPDHLGYNPSVAGLNLNFNRIYFEWARNGQNHTATLDARSPKYRPQVDVVRLELSNRGAPVYQFRQAGGRDLWSVSRGALGKGGARWIPVRQPERYAGEVFATFAGAHGLRLSPPEVMTAAPQGDVVATLHSAPLSDIVRGMLKYSTNLTAEVIGLAATQARGYPGASLRMSAALMSSWARQTYGMTTVALVDHSGLGDRSRMGAADMVQALQLARGVLLKPLMKSIRLPDRIAKLPGDVP